MKLARLLRRVVVVAVLGTTLGVGMGVAATPAHAMSREECNYYRVQAVRHYYRFLEATDPKVANAHFAASEAAWDVYYENGCNRRR